VAPHRANHAFSLVELIVAIGVAAVLLASAVLALARVDAAMQLDTGLRQIASDLQSARTTAIASAHRVRIVFTVGSDRYRRERADDGGQYHRDLDRFLPRGIRILTANAGAIVVFSARGDAQNATITLADAHGTSRAIVINQRGRITILAAS
jgi:prepilin-type N-terminal cleavage/methylation domain-containing protein